MSTLLAGSGWAGEVRMVEVRGAGHVVIEAADAGTDEILAVLAAHFGFTVERSGRGRGIRVSGSLQGSLDQLLERLLRHEGHMIVRSPAAPAGVSRVVLLAQAPRAATTAPAPPVGDSFARMSVGFPQKAKSQLPQLWGGTQ